MKVLVTAGTVYGRLDDNKLVGNRIRGIWATKFGQYLVNYGHHVTLLVPDTFDVSQIREHISDPSGDNFTLLKHDGYASYAQQCYELAPTMEAAVMAAAVVNWIPETPIKGKMKTDGYNEGAIINIPFILAPRVIDRMKKLNPKLTLIGCKMTAGSAKSETMKAAYATLLKGHCNVVVANDLSNLKEKTLVYPDGRMHTVASFERMYEELNAVLNDKHYRTEVEKSVPDPRKWDFDIACMQFDLLCEKYRERFKKRPDGEERFFGGLAVRIDENHTLVSPREKGLMFGSNDAVIVTQAREEGHIIYTVGGRKASLNALLLIRTMRAFLAPAVIHLHEENPDWPTVAYAPPGTARDNLRPIEAPSFNIEGHGCIFIERQIGAPLKWV